MNGKLLLDTNIVIAIFANDAAVMNSLADANEVFLPSIALGELYTVLTNQAAWRQILRAEMNLQPAVPS